jgi:hypothetical protein
MKYLIILLPLVFSCVKVVNPDLYATVEIKLQRGLFDADSGYAEIDSSGSVYQGIVLSFSSEYITGRFESVKLGKNQQVTVQLFRDILVKYKGTATFNVENEETIILNMDLLPVERPGEITCRPAFFECVVDSPEVGKYTLSWRPYEDSSDFYKGRFRYLVVKDTLHISDEFNFADVEVIYSDNVYNETEVIMDIGSDPRAYFRLFLMSEKYQPIKDCGGYFQEFQ